MKKYALPLLGNEAVAHAAIDSGIGGAFSYPGTPATEIFEYLDKYADRAGFCAQWSGNEKAAYEEALGMSYIGKRAIVSMKSVGINVAADPYICSALTGVNGGLVVVVADDPGMHSSQNEQDVRYYADFARTACFEPSSQQECYDMTKEAFRLSEKYKLPVVIRLVTRISHSRALVDIRPPENVLFQITLRQNQKTWVLLPSNARASFKKLYEKRNALIRYSENCPWNFIAKNKFTGDSRKGVICCSTGYNYLREVEAALQLEIEYLRLGFYPFAARLIREFLQKKDEVLVLEDGYPYVEERLLGVAGTGPKIHGRLDGTIETTGEINPEKTVFALAKMFGLKFIADNTANFKIPTRLPSFCPGCPHADTFKALKEALSNRKSSKVFSDIGCYTLAALKPYEAIDSCVEMGASIGMAKGASQGGLVYSVAVIGDSTFAHSGLTLMLSAAEANTPMTVIILDNNAVAMTGGQPSMINGDKLLSLLKGFGIPHGHIKTIHPLSRYHSDNVRKIKEELDYKGLSVIISRRNCIQIQQKK